MADGEMISYPLHLYWSLRALSGQLNPETLDRFQLQYRALYAVIGISMLCSLFISRKLGLDVFASSAL